MTALSKLGQAALVYSRNGKAVFPLHGIRTGLCTCGNPKCENPGKHPRTKHGFKDASTDAAKIREWWTRWPSANIGYAVIGHVVIDTDGEDGSRVLAELEGQYGKLPETLKAKTGRGEHLYFQADGSRIKPSAGKFGEHFDIRAVGSYTILPPSVHVSGKRYEWVNRDKPTPLPAAWQQLLGEPDRRQSSSNGTGERVPEGQRNAHLTSLAGSMRRRGMSPVAIEAALMKENAERCDPLLSETEVRQIAASVSRYAPAMPLAQPDGFTLTRLGDLMAEPQEQVSWLLEGILPAAGLGLLAAKPKTGKSTLARCLALAVARGETFLGRGTQKGAVIYLALEEKRSEVRGHFRDMGASGEEEIFIHAANAPLDALPSITVEVKRHKPVLLIIDPALRFVRVRDGNDYAQVSAALEPLLGLARENGCHTLLVHHLGKGERSEATDGILGSTALFAAVDTALVMKRYEKYRTLQSRQRYGDDLPETTLEFEVESRTISLGAERSAAETESEGREILQFLQTAGEPKTESEIRDEVKGETKILAHALRELVKQGRVTREGEGKRGKPYRYGFLFSCSEHIVQTSKQETEKSDASPINTERNLVCPQGQELVPGSTTEEPPKTSGAAPETGPDAIEV